MPKTVTVTTRVIRVTDEGDAITSEANVPAALLGEKRIVPRAGMMLTLVRKRHIKRNRFPVASRVWLGDNGASSRKRGWFSSSHPRLRVPSSGSILFTSKPGTVKWFSQRMGYGFIVLEEKIEALGGKDLHFRQSLLPDRSFRAGQPIVVDIRMQRNGRFTAANMVAVDQVTLFDKHVSAGGREEAAD